MIAINDNNTKGQQRTWQEAADECCARGGYLASFLDQDIDDMLLIAIKKRNALIESMATVHFHVF